MAWITYLRRPVAALAAAAGLLLLVGCGGSNSGGAESGKPSSTLKLTVKVNYLRIPLVTDPSGIPTGLETNASNFKNLPVRGVQVNVWEGKDETNPDGTKSRVWLLTQSSQTDAQGMASFPATPKDTDCFVEVTSVFAITNGGPIRIIGDPNGIDSTLSQADRVIYALRKGLDGSTPAGNPLPATKASGDVTVSFDVGLTDKWWLTQTGSTRIGQATQEAQGSGSRILAIVDSIYTVSFAGIGGITPGDTLDLHYRRGISDPRGTFVEYTRTRYPQAFDANSQTFHYFGSIRGGASNDDSFDEGVIFPLLARNNAWFQGFSPQGITGAPLIDLQPDMAMVEAFPFALACSLVKSPYLADTTETGVNILDIRNLGSTASGPLAAPAVAALGWEIILKANSLPSPGTATDWSKIVPAAATRFFSISVPNDLKDRPNVFLQLARLKEAKTAVEPVDLASLFTDTVISGLSTPFHIAWPRPTSGDGASYVLDWGADPNTQAIPISPLTLSMTKASLFQGTYPNSSSGEIGYARFTLSKDTAYNFSITTAPAVLPPGAQLEVRFLTQNLTFNSPGSSTPSRIVLLGNATTPIVHLVRVRLLSPSTVTPDIAVTVNLTPAN